MISCLALSFPAPTSAFPYGQYHSMTATPDLDHSHPLPSFPKHSSTALSTPDLDHSITFLYSPLRSVPLHDCLVYSLNLAISPNLNDSWLCVPLAFFIVSSSPFSLVMRSFCFSMVLSFSCSSLMSLWISNPPASTSF